MWLFLNHKVRPANGGKALKAMAMLQNFRLLPKIPCVRMDASGWKLRTWVLESEPPRAWTGLILHILNPGPQS